MSKISVPAGQGLLRALPVRPASEPGHGEECMNRALSPESLVSTPLIVPHPSRAFHWLPTAGE